jgi:hypothetical protein
MAPATQSPWRAAYRERETHRERQETDGHNKKTHTCTCSLRVVGNGAGNTVALAGSVGALVVIAVHTACKRERDRCRRTSGRRSGERREEKGERRKERGERRKEKGERRKNTAHRFKRNEREERETEKREGKLERLKERGEERWEGLTCSRRCT